MKNRIHIYYGDGKGKTTACTGLAIRALGYGLKVCIIYFDKGYDESNEHYSERKILRSIDNCELIPTGCERIMKNGKFRFGVNQQDIDEAKKALSLAKDKILNKNIDLLILDEILAATTYNLISQNDVMDLIELYYHEDKPFELVLSGHQIWEQLAEKVDLISEVKKVKHYFDQGDKAKSGIEF